MGLPSGVIVLTFDRVDSSGVASPTKMERIKGTVSGSNFVVASGGRGYDGSTEQAHTSPVVEQVWNATDWNDAVTALTNLVSATTGALDTTKVVDLTTAQTLTNKTLTAPLINEAVALTTTATELNALHGATLVTASSTTTFTNKRITRRVQSVADAATITPNADNDDVVDITAIAQAFTIANPSGTPTNKQMIEIEIKDNAIAHAITWGNGYVAGGTALPSTTVPSKILCVLLQYSTANALNKWRCIGTQQEA